MRINHNINISSKSVHPPLIVITATDNINIFTITIYHQIIDDINYYYIFSQYDASTVGNTIINRNVLDTKKNCLIFFDNSHDFFNTAIVNYNTNHVLNYKNINFTISTNYGTIDETKLNNVFQHIEHIYEIIRTKKHI